MTLGVIRFLLYQITNVVISKNNERLSHASIERVNEEYVPGVMTRDLQAKCGVTWAYVLSRFEGKSVRTVLVSCHGGDMNV